MTPEEKARQMEARNAAICEFYAEGRSAKQVASKFRIGRQRVYQILNAAGAIIRPRPTRRQKFLGVTITSETKSALEAKAEAEGTSVSKLVSDALDEVVK